MASVKIVKKALPHSITYSQIGDAKMRDVVMKIAENQKAIWSMIQNTQNAVIELQR